MIIKENNSRQAIISSYIKPLNSIVLYNGSSSISDSWEGNGLAKISPPTGSLIAYSTDHGQTAADGDGANSLYSKALAEKLLEEDVSIEQVFKNVRTEVLRLSNKTQSPVEESKLTGDVFYLNKKKVE